MTYTKFVHLNRNASGEVVDMKEVTVNQAEFQPLDTGRGYEPLKALTEAKLADGRTTRVSLKETFLTNPDAANILRNDVRFMAFSMFNQMPRTFESFVTFMDSNKPKEVYLRDAAIGVLPKVPSGTNAPNLISSFEGGVEIVNDRYAGIVEILGDWVRFDQIGKIRQAAIEMGRAARMTEEDAVYKFLTTTGNYTRNSTTGDNDVGANTQNLTFSGIGLETATTVISTAKDRKSGNYLGLKADTIIIGPRAEIPVKQLLLSAMVDHTGASEVRGLGTTNQYRGMINNIIISPWFSSSYSWALTDSTRQSLMFQTVEPFNVFQEDANVTSEAWLTRNAVRYLVQGYFGLGFVDDRCWFFSSSTTAPTVS